MLNIHPTTRPALALLALAGVAIFASTHVLADDIETKAREAILLDPTTSTVILSKNGEESMPPASISKHMTIYMLFRKP